MMRSDGGQGTLAAPVSRRLLGCAWVLFIIVCGCATAPVPPGASGARIEGVPFFPQEEYQCGPASLAGVMNYWKVHVTPGEVAREIFSTTARGTVTIDMALYPERKGLRARHYRGSWEDLMTKIAGGYPLVVLVDRGFSLYQANHFMVVTGFGEGGVVVNSGLVEQGVIEIGTFLKGWERAGFWTLWVYPWEG